MIGEFSLPDISRLEPIRTPKGRVITVKGWDQNGVPNAALVPTWVVYANAITNTALSPPGVTNLGGGNYKFTATGANPAGILDLGSTALPRYFVYVSFSSVFVFAAFSLLKAPLPGLSPTWVTLKRVSDGTNYTPQPALSAIGGGLYKTSHISERLTGVIDLGETASPRYVSYDTDRPTILIPVPES